MSAPPVEVGQIVANKYQVDNVIGQGGMGIVVAAHHIELDQKVAIKFLLAEAAEYADAAERFRREARAAAQIHSDHVARVLDVGSLPEGVPFMVMEHLEGYDLGAKMASREPIPIPEAVGYALEAIDAVAQAHKAGIVHRDLKPANLFLAKRPDGSLRIKVLDFGISKSVRDSTGDMRLTSTTTLIGSPLYMSPEQMRSARDVDGRADIWSLGAIIFEMLAGRPPYQASTLPALCEELLTRDPPRLRELRPDIPENLEAVVARCLARDLEQRWPNIVELARALAPFAPGHRSVRPLLSEDHTGTDDEARATAPGAESNREAPKTLDPWGGTQDKAPSKKTVVAIGLALLAVVFIGALLLILDSEKPGTPAGSNSAGKARAPEAERHSETEAATQVVVTPAGESSNVLEPDSAPPVESSKAAAPRVSVMAKPKPVVPPQPATTPAQAPPPSQPVSKPDQNSAVPDFGGRR